MWEALRKPLHPQSSRSLWRNRRRRCPADSQQKMMNMQREKSKTSSVPSACSPSSTARSFQPVHTSSASNVSWSGLVRCAPHSPWADVLVDRCTYNTHRTIKTMPAVLTGHRRPPHPPYPFHVRLPEILPSPPPYVPSPSCSLRWSAYCRNTQTSRTCVGPTRPRRPRRGRCPRTRGQSAQMAISARPLREGKNSSRGYIHAFH